MGATTQGTYKAMRELMKCRMLQWEFPDEAHEPQAGTEALVRKLNHEVKQTAERMTQNLALGGGGNKME